MSLSTNVSENGRTDGAIQYLYAPATANETTNRIQLLILL
ncbi:hypothetical protein Cha6605_2638 [Chamaesiphon minutus PCC 6605]|uniref:Uncharacterized protein n=1 Tax=Chamaesiphon minutus (strain ATCC 27169 / PCC 6605) TaxID=1173020 RepID=K9UEY3_CHAP6|nr:hypothetical protein Cha6605_2638 [Chamaesiphon minutus PCC 6605]